MHFVQDAATTMVHIIILSCILQSARACTHTHTHTHTHDFLLFWHRHECDCLRIVSQAQLLQLL